MLDEKMKLLFNITKFTIAIIEIRMVCLQC